MTHASPKHSHLSRLMPHQSSHTSLTVSNSLKLFASQPHSTQAHSHEYSSLSLPHSQGLTLWIVFSPSHPLSVWSCEVFFFSSPLLWDFLSLSSSWFVSVFHFLPFFQRYPFVFIYLFIYFCGFYVAWCFIICRNWDCLILRFVSIFHFHCHSFLCQSMP